MKSAKPKSCRVWCCVYQDGVVQFVRMSGAMVREEVRLMGPGWRTIPATLRFRTPKKKGKS